MQLMCLRAMSAISIAPQFIILQLYLILTNFQPGSLHPPPAQAPLPSSEPLASIDAAGPPLQRGFPIWEAKKGH
jgi:hypothetical protein